MANLYPAFLVGNNSRGPRTFVGNTCLLNVEKKHFRPFIKHLLRLQNIGNRIFMPCDRYVIVPQFGIEIDTQIGRVL